MNILNSEDATLNHEPHGEYVTSERVAKVADLLDDGERVEYLTRGSTVDVEGAGAGRSLFGNDRSRKTGTRGWVRAAFTDRRIVIKIPQWTGSDERSIPYENILSVDLDTGIVKKRLTIQTAGAAYHIEIDNPDKGECREIVGFVRERMTDAQQSAAPATDTSGNSPAERLREVEALHADGLLSDGEYEEKRERILSEL